MTAHEKFDYWLELAQYDIGTAEAMFRSGIWLYVVFMCQQAIEKLVKGLYGLYLQNDAPYVHNIRSLLAAFEDRLPEKIGSERNKLFVELTAHYISGRYPDYKEKLNDKLNKSVAKDFLEKSKEAFTWLLTMKP
jgi:HEPN domain-containing protein